MKNKYGLRLLALALFAASALAAAAGTRMAEETLRYKVMFKWGLINKQAGRAELTLTHGPTEYISQLTASSEPWADRIYRVRDTLNGRMDYDRMAPLFYEKIANEGNERKHDTVLFTHNADGSTSASCTRRVIKKGSLTVDEERTMASEAAAVDMLSSFYFMRTLPYENWKKGHSEKIDIFSGKRKELLTIKYNGIDNVDVGGESRKAYHITFIFTSGGGAKTSDDMEAWISADDSRIPLRLEGKLPVGKVHCVLVD